MRMVSSHYLKQCRSPPPRIEWVSQQCSAEQLCTAPQGKLENNHLGSATLVASSTGWQLTWHDVIKFFPVMIAIESSILHPLLESWQAGQPQGAGGVHPAQEGGLDALTREDGLRTYSLVVGSKRGWCGQTPLIFEVP